MGFDPKVINLRIFDPPPPRYGAKIALAIQAKWEGLACGQSVLWNLLKRQRRPKPNLKTQAFFVF